MAEIERTPYLFLIAKRSIAMRREAAQRVKETGRAVVAQYADVAIEVLATPEEAEALNEIGLFSAYLKGPMSRAHFERLDEAQRKVVTQWNVRFSASYRKLKADRTNRGKSWGEKGVDAPLPYTPIDPHEFRRILQEHRGDLTPDLEKWLKDDKPRAKKPAPLSGERFVAYERELAKIYKDKTFAYHLARFGKRMRAEKMMYKLPDWLIDLLRKLFFPEADCWKMTGEMSVGIVFVESSRADGPKFGNAERGEILQEIVDGLNWLAAEHPAGDLSWVYDNQEVKIDVANGNNDSEESYWRDPAMALVTYNGNTYAGNFDAVAEYRDDMRVTNNSEHGIAIFVTPYGNSWHAYAGGGKITLANRNNWGGWGQAGIDIIAAHEMSHNFGSSDEYTGSGTPCSACDTLHGCDQIPNGNCGACAHPTQPCMMGSNDHRICDFTRGQIGWADIFVETFTADELWAGTDDDVWVDIGDREFVLDTPGVNDREQNSHDGYAIWVGGISRGEIKRCLVRKSGDGFSGGWKMRRFILRHAGVVLCDQSPNVWLEDDHRWWAGCMLDGNIVNQLSVKVTTANVNWAGTDDDVSLNLSGRSWNLDNSWQNDFERSNTDTFDLDPGTGLHVSDIHSVEIHKSPDGFAGGWKLKAVELWVNGVKVYNNQGINTWLEDDHRTWSDVF